MYNPNINANIGIIGCGHLGQALAIALLQNGFAKAHLRVSYGGSPHTLARLQALGLTECVSDNETMLRTMDYVFLTTHPNGIASLRCTQGKALVISCMAGVSLSYLQKHLGEYVMRMMPCGPEPILSGQGIAALYPAHECVQSVLSAMKLHTVAVVNEEELNVFTAGVCLPAALLLMKRLDLAEQEIHRIRNVYPILGTLYDWACSVVPKNQTYEQVDAYINEMATKGGVTEAIVTAIREGAKLDEALRAGIIRTNGISKIVEKSIMKKEF